MAQHTSDSDRRNISLRSGAKRGLVSGAGFVILCWILAGVSQLLMGWISPAWSNRVVETILEVVLSDWWMVVIIVSFTAVGALYGALAPRRYDLL